MNFQVVSSRSQIRQEPSKAYLVRNDWDDYGFKTFFYLVFIRSNGEQMDIGPVKILKRGMPGGYVEIPEVFNELGMDYCSLGQDQNYYETLAAFVDTIHEPILLGLRDCVHDPKIFEEFSRERAMEHSLLRSVSGRNVTETFRGILRGQAYLTPFRFSYTYPVRGAEEKDVPSLTFSVEPRSTPPTNVHAIIGRNGVGKTTLLSHLARALCQPRTEQEHIYGEVEFIGAEINVGEEESFSGGERFTNLITVAFSAFDPFEAMASSAVESSDIRQTYIGLRKNIFSSDPFAGQADLKNYDDLSAEFLESFSKCMTYPRSRRWRDAIEILQSDPLFRDADLLRLVQFHQSGERDVIDQSFRSLSSGHKIVLLTVTRLVEFVDDRTLVLFDEPESHLHPPLLASFLRVISDLLMLRNGAAIIATHSPVVLQEVPKTCVWFLRRSGDVVVGERPSLETFGENVSVLTREAFGLEVTQSGFHKMISAALNASGGSYDGAVEQFGGQLGTEARAIALAISRSQKQ